MVCSDLFTLFPADCEHKCLFPGSSSICRGKTGAKCHPFSLDFLSSRDSYLMCPPPPPSCWLWDIFKCFINILSIFPFCLWWKGLSGRSGISSGLFSEAKVSLKLFSSILNFCDEKFLTSQRARVCTTTSIQLFIKVLYVFLDMFMVYKERKLESKAVFKPWLIPLPLCCIGHSCVWLFLTPSLLDCIRLFTVWATREAI